jgi:uncharacterized membrane protein
MGVLPQVRARDAECSKCNCVVHTERSALRCISCLMLLQSIKTFVSNKPLAFTKITCSGSESCIVSVQSLMIWSTCNALYYDACALRYFVRRAAWMTVKATPACSTA